MSSYANPPKPVHIPGTAKGEEVATRKGKEPGRSSDGRSYRSARDSTGINPQKRQPILPIMPSMPPS